MEKIELELERSNRNASILRSGTDTKKKSSISISYFIEGKKILWSLRLNEVGNRITHLSFVSAIFLARNLLLSLKESSGVSPSIHWPGIRGMNGLTKYLGEDMHSHWKASNINILSVGEIWEKRVGEQLAPLPSEMDKKVKSLSEQLQKKLGGSGDEKTST